MSSLFLGADKQSRSLWMRQLRKCRSALSTGHPSIQFIHVGYNGSVNCVLVFPTRANGHSKHMKAQLDTFTLEPNSCACLCLIYKVHIWHTHDKYFLLIHIFKTPPPQFHGYLTPVQNSSTPWGAGDSSNGSSELTRPGNTAAAGSSVATRNWNAQPFIEIKKGKRLNEDSVSQSLAWIVNLMVKNLMNS